MTLNFRISSCERSAAFIRCPCSRIAASWCCGVGGGGAVALVGEPVAVATGVDAVDAALTAPTLLRDSFPICALLSPFPSLPNAVRIHCMVGKRAAVDVAADAGGVVVAVVVAAFAAVSLARFTVVAPNDLVVVAGNPMTVVASTLVGRCGDPGQLLRLLFSPLPKFAPFCGGGVLCNSRMLLLLFTGTVV